MYLSILTYLKITDKQKWSAQNYVILIYELYPDKQLICTTMQESCGMPNNLVFDNYDKLKYNLINSS